MGMKRQLMNQILTRSTAGLTHPRKKELATGPPASLQCSPFCECFIRVLIGAEFLSLFVQLIVISVERTALISERAVLQPDSLSARLIPFAPGVNQGFN